MLPPLPAQDVRRLSSRRWLIAILAAMSAERGSRFSVLARRLEISHSVLSRHLDTLESFGWIAPNAGHGHPLRPEYLLTAAGRPTAAWCERMMAQRVRLELEPLIMGRWSLPAILELRAGWRRFSELQRGLAPITPRALSLTLAQLADVELVHRRVEDRRQLYGLTKLGERFADPLFV